MAISLPADKYFFHYTTRDSAFGSILPSQTLRLSTYGEMRDPLENQPWDFTFGGYGERDDATLQADLEGDDRFEKTANENIRDCSHLLSLTIDAEPRPGESKSHFAEGGLGLACGSSTPKNIVESAWYSIAIFSPRT